MENKIELLIKKEKMLLNCANMLIQFNFEDDNIMEAVCCESVISTNI